MVLKNGSLRAYFVPQDKEAYYKGAIFGQILSFIQAHPRRCRMKEVKGKLILNIEEIGSIAQAREILHQMVS